MDTRQWGLTTEQLAEHATSFKENLFAGQTFLISGGGSGIGHATAFLAARLGAQVKICGRNEEKLQTVKDDVKRLLNKNIAIQAMTIRDPEQVDQLIKDSVAELGKIDHLVNSAGGQYPQNALDFSINGLNAVVDTNLNGTWYMMQSIAKHWRDNNQAGHVVNIVANIDRGIPQSAHTAAARAGVVYLSKSVAVEWAPLHIRVNCVAPGTIETEGLNNYPPGFEQRLGKGNPMRRMGSTWDIAESVVYLAAPSGNFINGEYLHVNGGMHLWGTNWPLGVPEEYREG